LKASLERGEKVIVIKEAGDGDAGTSERSEMRKG